MVLVLWWVVGGGGGGFCVRRSCVDHLGHSLFKGKLSIVVDTFPFFFFFFSNQDFGFDVKSEDVFNMTGARAVNLLSLGSWFSYIFCSI